eukprot:scaffold132623_cov36-Cyclotella_meneghiniana.AAC.1
MKWRGVEFGECEGGEGYNKSTHASNIISALTVMFWGGKYGADVMIYAVFGGSGVDARPIAG